MTSGDKERRADSNKVREAKSGGVLAFGAKLLLGFSCLLLLAAELASAQCSSLVIASPSTEGRGFGSSMAISGDYLYVGAPSFQCVVQSGTVHVFKRNATGVWIANSSISPPPSANGVAFGSSVATEGARVIVGAPGESAAYVFLRIGDLHVLEQKLVGCGFGAGKAVAIEGTLAAVGASNSFCVYRRLSQGWVLEHVQGPPQLGCEGSFVTVNGFSPALLIEHGVIFVSGGRASIVNYCSFGGAEDYLPLLVAYSSSEATWAISGLHFDSWCCSSTTSTPFSYGDSLASYGDLLVVGSPAISTINFHSKSTHGMPVVGAVHFNQPAVGEMRGAALAVADDWLAVGAPQADGGNGAVYLMYRVGTAWHERERLSIPSGGFGSALLMTPGDLLVGAPQAVGFGCMDPPGEMVRLAIQSDEQAWGCPPFVSAEAGGVQKIALQFSQAEVAQIYLLLGSASGTVPGTPWGILNVPLNLDQYTIFTLSSPNGVILQNSLGVLDSTAYATVHINLPPLGPTFVGLTLNHAALTVDVFGPPGSFTAVSNAVRLRIIP